MDAISAAVQAQREFYASGRTRDIDFRRESLCRLREALLASEDRFCEAFREDLHKPPFEVFGTEIGMVSKEIGHHLKKLRKWARPDRVLTDLLNFPARSRVLHEPFGVALIMSPWNYPLQLALLPLVGAIAAGNCALLKPAHYSTRVAEVIAAMIAETFPPEYITVVTGGREVNRAVLDQRFDFIFFTGSPFLGRMVMEKAARHLTPVVLELGGKSPCIVERDANLKVAAQRLTFGKFLNAGQTCIAPDHLYVHRTVKAPLLEQIDACIRRFYGDDPERSPDFGRVINDQHFQRLEYLLRSAGRIYRGGRTNRETRYIEPTVICDVGEEYPIMGEEIFGPLLPVLEFDRLENVIARINARDKPLALYFFTSSDDRRDLLLASTSSGGGCINDTIMHVTNPHMPFGGVGTSGMGSYHGKFSFDTFSHHRSVLQKTTRFNPSIPYPPYLRKPRWIRRLLG